MADPKTEDKQLDVTLSFMETRRFLKEEQDEFTIFVQQGGSRSGKTYGIAQALVLEFIEAVQEGRDLRISCVRERMPSLKASAMRDVWEIMRHLGIYDEAYHNKTDNIYQIGGAEFEFFSLDDAQKVRGRSRHILWANEGNEIDWESWKQLNQRTSQQSIIDYNPSMEHHWIYDYLLGEALESPRADIKYLQTTYKDNPFLTEKIIREIEWYEEVDPNAWRIYGLGERGFSGATIFPRYYLTNSFPENPGHRPTFGLDFGYNAPSALVQVARPDERNLYWRQVIYAEKLTNQDLIQRLKEVLPPGHIIYADSAEPGRIEEIRQAGIHIKFADKRPHSIRDGIDFIKRHKLWIDRDSTDLIKEVRGYKWKTTRDGEVLDQPSDAFPDHGIDSARYGTATAWGKPKRWLAA